LPSIFWNGESNCGIRYGGSGATSVIVQGSEALRSGPGGFAYMNYPTTTGGNANLYMHTTDVIYKMTSARKRKRDIRSLGEEEVNEWFDQLQPRWFKAKPEFVMPDADPEREIIGFIADEVAEVTPA